MNAVSNRSSRRRRETVVPRANEPVRRRRIAVPEQRRLQRGLESTAVRLHRHAVHGTDVRPRIGHVGVQRQPAHDDLDGRFAGHPDANRGAGVALQNRPAGRPAAADQRRIAFARSAGDLAGGRSRAGQRPDGRTRKGMGVLRDQLLLGSNAVCFFDRICWPARAY